MMPFSGTSQGDLVTFVLVEHIKCFGRTSAVGRPVACNYLPTGAWPHTIYRHRRFFLLPLAPFRRLLVQIVWIQSLSVLQAENPDL